MKGRVVGVEWRQKCGLDKSGENSHRITQRCNQCKIYSRLKKFVTLRFLQSLPFSLKCVKSLTLCQQLFLPSRFNESAIDTPELRWVQGTAKVKWYSPEVSDLSLVLNIYGVFYVIFGQTQKNLLDFIDVMTGRNSHPRLLTRLLVRGYPTGFSLLKPFQLR